MKDPSTSRYSIEQELLLYKVKKAWREFERNQKTLEDYRKNYFCENSPFDQHDFRPYQPFVGCFKYVCRFCLKESGKQNFRQSVYAYKGKRFGSFQKKPKKKKTE